MSFRPIWYLGPQEYKASDRENEIGRNSQVFATRDEALASAKARFNDWTQPTDFGVEETEDRVTYVRKNNTDYSLEGLNQ